MFGHLYPVSVYKDEYTPQSEESLSNRSGQRSHCTVTQTEAAQLCFHFSNLSNNSRGFFLERVFGSFPRGPEECL